jgi:hypothetical protein
VWSLCHANQWFGQFEHLIMKRLIAFSVVLILCCGVAVSVGYLVGKRVGGYRATTARAACAVLSLDAAKKLRAGDLPEATRELERHCFADSVVVLSDVGWRVEAFRKITVPSLKAYRRSYRTNEADWTPMEKELEGLLAHKP